jgi:hypothetical protein
MAVTAKRLITPAQLTTSAATYYTTPANTRTVIKKLTLTNSTTTPRLVTVYLVPSGGTAGATNILTSTRTVGANQTWDCTDAQGHVLEAGATIQALADGATAVTIHGSGVEIA